MIDLNNIKKIYFIGIGGIAMSAVASLAKQKGFAVLGSESKDVYDPAKKVLKDHGIPFEVGYDIKNIENANADLYVLSAGEGQENPEVKFVLENNLQRIGFPELLYELEKETLRIVVTGTHGKTTTSGLLGHVLKNLDKSGFMVGGVLQNYNSNFAPSEGHYFVIEGDEYKTEFDDPAPKFHFYKPDILVLTNLEYDHPDLFENFEALEIEFKELLDKMPEDGLIVYNADDANLVRLVHQSNVASVSFAINNEADFKIENIQYGVYTKFQVMNKLSKDKTAQLLDLNEEYQIQLPGKMNVCNALAVIATLRTLGFQPENIALDLLSFKGVKRRFELVGVKKEITLIDDYAHHPTAVKETLDAVRLKYFSPTSNLQPPTSKLWAVFEPHTFSRTKATLPELCKAFGSADMVLISEIYPAREKISNATIKSSEVINAIKIENGKLKTENSIRLVEDKQQALDILKNELKHGDVVIVMAVGAFNRLAYELKEIL